MPIEITLLVSGNSYQSGGSHIQLLDLSGIEASEGLEYNINRTIDNCSLESRSLPRLREVPENNLESATVSKISWHLLQYYPATSWSITIQYSDGRDAGQLLYKPPGGVPIQTHSELPDAQRVSRYTRKPVI